MGITSSNVQSAENFFKNSIVDNTYANSEELDNFTINSLAIKINNGEWIDVDTINLSIPNSLSSKMEIRSGDEYEAKVTYGGQELKPKQITYQDDGKPLLVEVSGTTMSGLKLNESK